MSDSAYIRFGIGKPASDSAELADDTIDAAIDGALDSLGRAGYCHGMLSLLFNDGDDQWIVAHAARGEIWKGILLPATRRKLGEGDILPIVVSTCRPAFVSDAQRDAGCDRDLAQRAGVISFYALPILAEEGEAIGVLQVDLGDMRNEKVLPPRQKTRLDSLGGFVSLLVSRAIRAEELRFVRRLDEIQAQCLQYDSVEQAFSHFVKVAAEEMKVNVHIRLRGEDGSFRLIDGIGKYFEACRYQRSVIGSNEAELALSAEMLAVERKRPVIVNDAYKDPRHAKKLEMYRGTPLAEALMEVKSYADFPIGKPNERPVGIVSFSSSSPWFFTQDKLRSWSDIGRRLSFLAEHMHAREEKNRSLVQLRFIRDITPSLELQQHTFEALRTQVTKIAESAHANAVSCYLWDPFRRRCVLRAQQGWRMSNWLDAAWYEENEGLTGSLAISAEPTYIPDARGYESSLKKKPEKYLNDMFHPPLADSETYELIALPLHFKSQHLGVVTLHRRRDLSCIANSGFATTDTKLLKEASDVMSAFVAALCEHETLRWEAEELQRRHQVLLELNDSATTPIEACLTRFCESVVQQYSIRRCAVYIKSHDTSVELWGAATRSGMPIESEIDPLVTQCIESGKLQTSRSPRTEEQNCPVAVRTEDVIERVVLPIALHKTVIGALDLRWKGIRRTHDKVLPHHDTGSLQELANRLGETIRADQLRRDVKLSQTALDGIAVYLRDRFHWLAHSLATVEHDIKKLSTQNVDREQSKLIEHAKEVVGEQRELIRRVRFASQRIVDVRREICAIDELLREAIGKHQSAIDQNGIELNCLEVEHFGAFVDGIQVLECFDNIISNAVNAMPKGGSLMLTLRCEREDRCWHFEAVDNGPGFNPCDYEGSFEKDDRIHGGVGLLLTRLYCESHSGRLEIRSNSGAGTKVSVRMPLTETGRKLVGT